MDLGSTYQIIIPATLAEIAVSKREINGKYAVKTGKGYRVATELHYLSFFCILKAYSPNSGHIHQWTDELETLMSISNLSRRGLYKYINKLKEMELIYPDKIQSDGRRKLSSFSMVSWDRLAEKYELDTFKKFIPIVYEKDNQDHHPKYLLIKAEIQHNQDKQAYMIGKKCKRFKQNYAQQQDPDFPSHKATTKLPNSTPDKDRATAFEIGSLWTKLFRGYKADTTSESEDEYSASFYNFISKINPSINRGLEGFRRSYSFSDLHRSIYLKKQLEKRGFGTFKRSIKIYSEVENRPAKFVATNEDGTSKTKQMKSVFNRQTKQSGVWLPDSFISNKPKKAA
ncbi:MAG: hypothetical protein K9H61_02385 [Bacteroidia bacterium]|nr:hypothetical protein [Bacteroidia bacterium]MCF8427174.1 hypothetical protein [Bacteroidia bacterium]MCF8445819.1 hypothetical protein [Bacteroidia bacterium]